MIGIVVVSHSRPLAEAAVALASQMVPENPPAIAVAAGLDDGGFGTDAMAIMSAIEEVGSDDGVLVLVDLGSAILSSEMALEFLDPDAAARVRISSAPLVEGLIAATVQASTGASLDAVDAEARSALAPKREQLGEAEPEPTAPAASEPEGPSVECRVEIVNAHGLHMRPAAAIVAAMSGLDVEARLTDETTGKGPVNATSLLQITGLNAQRGHLVTAAFAGPDADEALRRFQALADDEFGERAASTPTPEPTDAPAPGSERLAVIGRISRPDATPDTSGYVPGNEEQARFEDAVKEVDAFLEALADEDARSAGIIGAQRAILADPVLTTPVADAILAGTAATEAVDLALGDRARRFDELADPYLRERGQDIRSLRRLLLLSLVGQPLAAATSDEPTIWVVDELDTATATRLSPERCLGVVTISGGATGHGMLAAQGRGIPVLPGATEAAVLVEGQEAGFDPVTREVWSVVDDELRKQVANLNASRERQASEAQSIAQEDAVTRSGSKVLVEANIGSLDDARDAAAAGADGSGLVRTEVLWASRIEAPAADEQAATFVEIGKVLGQMITVRTWDPAGDKPLAFLPLAGEQNPALGVRGIRAMRAHPELLEAQFVAVLTAAKDVPIRVMLPMVSEPDEIRWARSVMDEARSQVPDAPAVPLGMMVEVPAAAIRAKDFAGLVDFVSIGTNDLTQYTQAADRVNAAVRDLARADAPAVLDLIVATCDALPGIPIAVCGDLASDPATTAALIDAGVRELSVRPRMVPEVKLAVRETP